VPSNDSSHHPDPSVDSAGPPDPVARIDALASGYREAQILMTAVRLGLFEALAPSAADDPADASADADTLAERLGADPRGVRILCDALAALGILEKHGGPNGRYRNGEGARTALLPGGPRSKVAMLRHGARLYERWARLYDAVLSGAPVPEEAIDPRLASDERSFAAAMSDVARESAIKAADALEALGALEGVRRILDVGGGPGHYAVELLRRLPEARGVVLDGRQTVAVARETAERAGVADRFEGRSGDAFGDDLSAGGPFDLIFVSNLVHIYSAAENRRLIGNAARALAPGGHLAIKDFLLDDDRTRPVGGSLFAVNMLVSTEAGDCYTVNEVRGWFEEHGLSPGPTIDLTRQSRLSLARTSEARRTV
jgi:SAM-dependent methyltransferase